MPSSITAPGVYCLTSDLTYTVINAPAITIDSAAVVLDFQGYRIRWLGATTSGHAAVQVLKQNVTVRNGLISGFEIGVASSAPGTVVEDMRMNENALGVSIQQGGEGAIIRRNYIRSGSGIEVYGNNSASTFGEANTGSVRIIDNDIHGPEGEGNSGVFGIAVYSKNAFVVGNRVARVATGVWFDTRIQATGKYRDNLTLNVNIPYTGGTDVGNNN